MGSGRRIVWYLCWTVLAVMWRSSRAGVASGSGDTCYEFSSFPESAVISIGSNICFTCDYPDTEGEYWTASCSTDMDSMCSCAVNNNGVELCFSSFNSDCSGTYQCEVNLELSETVCSAQADFQATDEVFIEHPVSVNAVRGNSVSFECSLLSGNTSVVWQRKNSTDLTFLNSSTMPGTYSFGPGTKLTIQDVQPGHAGQYRCALPVEGDLYLYSNFSELTYLGEGVTLSFEEISYSLVEGNSTMVCVRATGNIPIGYTIDFSVISSDGTATTLDYSLVNFTRNLVGIVNPSCVEMVLVATVEDSLVESNETFTISLTSSSFIVTTANATIQITILNDDYVTLELPLTRTVSEDVDSLSLCISSQGQLSGTNATFNVYTADGTATDSGADYDPASIDYVITSTNSEETCVVSVSVVINDDSTPEPEQCFTLNLQSTDSKIIVGNPVTSICIEDNDNITIQFLNANFVFYENSVVGVGVIYDVRPENLTIRYNLTSSSQTATSIEDYNAENVTVIIAGFSYQYNLTIEADDVVEGNETFTLQLSSSNPRVNLNTPTTTITIIDDDKRVDINLEQSAYTFSESDGTVSICLVTSNEITYNFPVSFDISVNFPEFRPATVGVDFTSTVFVLILQAEHTTVCTNGTLLDDSSVEGTESFYLIFRSSDTNIILNSNSGQNSIESQVYIQDTTVFEVGFQIALYSVRETAGLFQVCLFVLDNGALIVSGVSVDVYLTENSDESLDGIAFNLPTDPLTFTSNILLLCQSITVINDTTGHGNRSTLLGVTGRDSEFTVSSDTTTVIFIDEQEGISCGELFCYNGGLCLDDSDCVCPSQYTGSDCDTRIPTEPTLVIDSPDTPVLGDSYTITCSLTVDSEINLEDEISSTIMILWTKQNGELEEDTVIGNVTLSVNTANSTLALSSLTTSDAGSYTCTASLFRDGSTINLQQSIDLTFILPTPILVFVLQIPRGDVEAGSSLSLLCTSISSSYITTPYESVFQWMVGDGEDIPNSPRFNITADPSSTTTSTLTINPALVEDSDVYSCQVYCRPTEEFSEFLSGSSSNSITSIFEVSVTVSDVTVSLTAQTERVPNIPPYNTFELICSAKDVDYLSSLSFEFRWVRVTGPEQEATVVPNSQTTIATSESAPVSVLTLTKTQAAQYVFYCEISYLYGETVVTSGTSSYADVTLTSPSNPSVPVNVTVYGVGADFVIVEWTIFRVEYTPETYFIEYAEFTEDDSDPVTARVQYPTTNDDFNSIDAEFVFVVDGLSPSALYGFKVIAQNSVGESTTSEYVYADTIDEEPFAIQTEETSFIYPIGARINIEYTVENILFLGEGGFNTTVYAFLPELHTPLQQPSIIADNSTVLVQYRSASPSLSGAYVLCSDSATPFICGGRVSLSIEIPSLTISTDLLVSQYVNGVEVNSETPEIVCMPSDIRAPVKWSTTPIYVNLTQKYNASFRPMDLNHTLRFPSTYNQLPEGTLRVVCDLINVDNPEADINPVTATVIFIQNPVALLNNDKEMESNAVINSFSSLDSMDFLSLVCVGTTGNGQLVWERISGDSEDVLTNSESITIEYFSDDERDTSLRLQPITSDSVGEYICRSVQSGQETSVLVTTEDPYLDFSSPTSYDIPIGVRVEISARYAYSSNGIQNSGAGFSYSLVYQNTTEPSQEWIIANGSVNQSSNNFIYALYGNQTNSGSYVLTFIYSGTEQMYQQTAMLTATVPYIEYYEAMVIGRRGYNVTLTCIPSDLRAPILWEIEGLILHDHPSFFTFDLPSVRHRVTTSFFVGGAVASCGLMDGNDDRNLVNATDITLTIQDERIKLEHANSDLEIYNNTVINMFGSEGEGEGGLTTTPPPDSKRQATEENSLYIDCLASQGDHRPFWTTSNPLDSEGSDLGYGTMILSNYVARLSFDFFTADYEGVYTCRSNISNEFVEIFITSRNPYVKALSGNSITVIEDSSLTMEFKVAVDSNGNSWDSDSTVFTFTSLNQETSLEFTTCSRDFPQNYCYTLESVSRFDEGVYAATVISETEDVLADAINLTVTRRCPVDVNSGIQWPWTLESTTAYRPCREAGAMFRAGPKASRRCNEGGEWEGADLTSCTIAEVEDPFILVWFVIDANQYTNEQEEPFVNSMKEVLDMNGVQYSRVTLKSVYIASVAVTFQVDLVEDEQTSNISQLSSFVRDPESFSSFANYSVMEDGRGSVDIAVADTCRCSSADMGSSLQLCTGAGLSPCNCADDGSCSCQAPFVGDGNSCTLDSDGDGYPDEPLDSPMCTEDSTLSYCIADECPTIRNTGPDFSACDSTPSDDGFSGCPYEQDDVWGITWPATEQGEINTQPCPGGVDTLGNATRVCGEDGTWGNINVLLCQSLAIALVVEEAAERLPEADEEIEEVTPELLESVAVVSDQLVMATDSTMETGLLPLDLQATNDVVAQVLNVLESSTEADIDDVPSEELVDVFNNILNETNEEGWTQLQTVGAGSQSLLQNAERYGNYLATTVNDTDEPLMLTRENIVVAAQMVDSQNASDIVFPARPEQLGNFSSPERRGELAQITIPGDSISRLFAAGTNMTGVSLVYIIFRNIESFLPINTTNLNDSRAESLVLSSQLNVIGDAIPYDLFVDNPITLNFSFEASEDTIEAYTGVFWNFSNPVGRGGWSSDGIQVISNETRNNVTTVVCNSTHLTSFAVLVDVAGGVTETSEEEQLALQIVSYIGCIISTICLSITVVFYLSMGKKLFSAVHYFIHLNLSISLLLGYVVFLFGIQLGNSSQGGCGFVAALLQYLFLSAFCWMMCEGVMLYLMLIVVFSKLSKKWWFFLLLGYCTPLLFVVIGLAVRARYYGVRGEDGELAFCWLSVEKGTIFAFVAPMIVIIVINLVFLVLALAALYRSQKQKLKQNDTKSSKKASALLKATVILLPLLGVTWLFGLLTLNNNATVFAWLFTIFNSFQGTAIFYFHVIRSKTVWSKISPRVSRIKESVFKSSKYQISKSTSSYATSEIQSSTGTMRTLLRKRPINEYELSSPGPSSTLSKEPLTLSSVSEADIESTSAPEETSPTKQNPTGGVVITNPSTTTEPAAGNGDSSLNKEEIIDDKNEVTKL